MDDQNMRTNYSQLLLRPRLPRRFCEQINLAFIKLLSFISYYFCQAELPAVVFPHAYFAFTMTVILGLLQVKCQGKDTKTPFESHPITTSMAITCFLLYCLAYHIEIRFPPNRRCPSRARNVVRCSMLISGSLCLATTASFLFPDSVRPVIFVFYFMCSVAELLYWICQRFTRELRASPDGRRHIQQIFMNIWRPIDERFTNRMQILPL